MGFELNVDDALGWSARLIALAVLLQTLELLQLRRYLSDTGVWRYQVLATEHAVLPAPLRLLLAALLPYRAFMAVLLWQLGWAACLLTTGWLLAAAPLLLGALLVCVRFRGTFNGGSDSMTVLILLSLSVAASAGGHPSVRLGCAGYIAVQATLSYLLAGLTKLKESQWRDGRALHALLRCERYALPHALRAWLEGRTRLQLASLLVIAFECGFALCWLDRRVCIAFLLLGACFHLSNAATLGLNRFFFAWLASYPAVLYCSSLLGRW